MLAKLSVDQALSKARSYIKKNELAEAQKLYQAVLLSFPKNLRAKEELATLNKYKKNQLTRSLLQKAGNQLVSLYNQGQFSVVVEQAQVMADQYPKIFEFWNILGASANQLGMLDKAIEAYKKALLIKPSSAMVYSNLGVVLQSQGKLNESIEAHKKALTFKPDFAEAYNNMGITLKDQGKLDKAIDAYKKSILLKPNYVDAFSNLGNVLKEQGKLDMAISVYKKALLLKPNFAECYNNMGNALRDQGNMGEAVESFHKAIFIKPDYAQAYSNMGVVLQDLVFKEANFSLQKTITSLLDKKLYVRPRNIAKSVISLLKLDSNLKIYIQKKYVDQAKLPVKKIIAHLSELTLLLKFMSICPIADTELEYLLREIRARLLLSIHSFTSMPEVLRFQSALALHCFVNEYIYNQSEEEDKALKDLEETVKSAVSNNKQQNPQSILCLASYKSLKHYEWCDRLIISAEIEDVFIRQVMEPDQEDKLKFNIPLLKEINNEISSKVMKQYESNPYPRWVQLGLPLVPKRISKVFEDVKLKFFDDKIKNIKMPNILIAGCGTGQQSLETAARFKDSKVVAVDLSLASLAYAKRKTEELGVQNIEYMQADILDLKNLGYKFDIIESVGVLHHMNNPFEGWRVLTNCLKQGGLMRIGLYSELARNDISKIREEIYDAEVGSSDSDMKLFRSKLMKSGKKHHKQMHNIWDFYNLSELRDLLFHVKEHRYTIPKIQDCLSELGLKFCGFEGEKITSQFKISNTDIEDCYKLEKWQAYEEDNPQVFSGMYQFWCQKIS